MKTDGRQILTATVPVEALSAALVSWIQAQGIVSNPSGDYKKIVSLEYNPLTLDMRVSYEE